MLRKRLTLNATTIRNLTNVEIRHAAGGRTGPPGDAATLVGCAVVTVTDACTDDRSGCWSDRIC